LSAPSALCQVPSVRPRAFGLAARCRILSSGLRPARLAVRSATVPIGSARYSLLPWQRETMGSPLGCRKWVFGRRIRDNLSLIVRFFLHPRYGV
jgi:hypothetical protein